MSPTSKDLEASSSLSQRQLLVYYILLLYRSIGQARGGLCKAKVHEVCVTRMTSGRSYSKECTQLWPHFQSTSRFPSYHGVRDLSRRLQHLSGVLPVLPERA